MLEQKMNALLDTLVEFARQALGKSYHDIYLACVLAERLKSIGVEADVVPGYARTTEHPLHRGEDITFFTALVATSSHLIPPCMYALGIEMTAYLNTPPGVTHINAPVDYRRKYAIFWRYMKHQKRDRIKFMRVYEIAHPLARCVFSAPQKILATDTNKENGPLRF